jgi:Nucleotide modification associated domain 2
LRTWTYRLDHDLGFAPNPFFGWCTLACCKPKIREHAVIGDTIIGIAGAGKRGLKRLHPRIIYWMRVDEVLTFDEYWRDPRFSHKLPFISGSKMRMVGDRTYRHEPNSKDWSFETSMHYIEGAKQSKGGHVAADTKVDRVLASQNFSYYGACGPESGPHLLDLFPNPRGEKCPKDGPLLSELFALVELERPKFLVGDPADWNNERYFRKG